MDTFKEKSVGGVDVCFLTPLHVKPLSKMSPRTCFMFPKQTLCRVWSKTKTCCVDKSCAKTSWKDVFDILIQCMTKFWKKGDMPLVFPLTLSWKCFFNRSFTSSSLVVSEPFVGKVPRCTWTYNITENHTCRQSWCCLKDTLWSHASLKVFVLSCDLDSYPSISSENGPSYNVEIHCEHLTVFFSHLAQQEWLQTKETVGSRFRPHASKSPDALREQLQSRQTLQYFDRRCLE